MRAVAALLVALASACYSPELGDCTVTCTLKTECAEGQTCNIGFCVDEDELRDCRVVAPTADAAPPRTALMITVEGKGRIELPGIGACSSEPPQNGECTLSVARNASVTSRAVAIDDAAFERWTTTTCLGESETCQFTPSVPTLNLGAKFK